MYTIVLSSSCLFLLLPALNQLTVSSYALFFHIRTLYVASKLTIRLNSARQLPTDCSAELHSYSFMPIRTSTTRTGDSPLFSKEREQERGVGIIETSRERSVRQAAHLHPSFNPAKRFSKYVFRLQFCKPDAHVVPLLYTSLLLQC
jgi:hypothetical protein